MYAKGMSTRDIANQVNEMYGMNVSPTLISNIMDKIIPSIKEWQYRQLESIYPIVFMDAIHFKVKAVLISYLFFVFSLRIFLSFCILVQKLYDIYKSTLYMLNYLYPFKNLPLLRKLDANLFSF